MYLRDVAKGDGGKWWIEVVMGTASLKIVMLVYVLQAKSANKSKCAPNFKYWDILDILE